MLCKPPVVCIFAARLTQIKQKGGPVAQLNRASDYGSEGYRFESCRGHYNQSESGRE